MDLPAPDYLGFLGLPLVLVVDDDPDMLDFMSAALGGWADVHVAPGGEEGLAACRSLEPDLVILDVLMPGLDGFDVVNEIKHDPATRHIPVIFVTGDSEREIESACLEAGAADFIHKPVNVRVLTARVRTHLLLKQQADFLSALAVSDNATGAMARAPFDGRVDEEIARARRSGQPVSLLLVGVEDLPGYADTYGPLAADEVMVAVAGAIRGVARRRPDVLCRFDAASFAVLLPDLAPEGAGSLAGRIADAVRALGIPHAGRPDGIVSVSTHVEDATAHDGMPAMVTALAARALIASS